jgi:ATP-dependent Clp protease adaptor protein ClpS
MPEHKPGQQGGEQGDVLTVPKTEKPPKFKVLIFNDDYTTMEFVVFILAHVFRLTPAASHRLMLQIHRTGVGVAGVFVKEIAEARVDQTLDLARDAGHPLQCTMEPE